MRTSKILLLLSVLMPFSVGTLSLAEKANKRVAITAIVEHPALDQARQGVIDELKDAGYVEGQNLTVEFQSAQGNTATAAQIAKKYAGDDPDVIVGIGTPSAQALIASTRTVPIVYTAVTDPVAANLVRSWEATGGNVTGVSDHLPLEPQVELIKAVVPTVKNVGFVYSPGEVNSTIVLKELQEVLDKDGIKVVAAPAQRTTDISTAVKSLQGRVDVIYTSTDNNVVSAYESMYQAAVQTKIPLIASDTSSAERGAVAALGGDYYGMGRQTGKLVVRILEGEKAGDIPSEKPQKTQLYVNLKAAKQQGATLPQSMIDSATKVIE